MSWRRGFTLVELLVVLFILVMLATIALPTVRSVLLDQKYARAARSIASYLDVARNRAIAEQREVGVLFERLSTVPMDTDGAIDRLGRATSIRLRQLTGVPPYSGESGDARAMLQRQTSTIRDFDWSTVPGINEAAFDAADNQLLAISAQLIEQAIAAGDPSISEHAPIRERVDRLELPGGKVVPILQISITGDIVFVRFDLRHVSDQAGTFIYPSGARRQLTPSQRVKYRIHRSPALSSSGALTLPRGAVVDLNYSGVGLAGNQFAPPNDEAIANPIAVIFGPDGRVSRISNALGNLLMPASQLYFCLGDFGGVRPDAPLAATGRDRANIARPKSSWIVVNNQTGRVSVSPLIPVNAANMADPTMAEVLVQARTLAALNDPVTNE